MDDLMTNYDEGTWSDIEMLQTVASPIRQPENANGEEELIFFSAEELTLSDIEMLQAVASPKTVNDENKDGEEDDATNWELTVIEEGDIDFHIEDRSPSHISIISSCDDDDDEGVDDGDEDDEDDGEDDDDTKNL